MRNVAVALAEKFRVGLKRSDVRQAQRIGALRDRRGVVEKS